MGLVVEFTEIAFLLIYIYRCVSKLIRQVIEMRLRRDEITSFSALYSTRRLSQSRACSESFWMRRFQRKLSKNGTVCRSTKLFFEVTPNMGESREQLDKNHERMGGRRLKGPKKHLFRQGRNGYRNSFTFRKLGSRLFSNRSWKTFKTA